MKTMFVLFGFLLALVQCDKKPGLQNSEEKPEHKNYCDPTDECLANGGYCIENSKKGDCDGILFSKECKSAQCSCCIEVLKKEDECAEGEHTCPTNSKCQDKEIGYECACNAGFKKCGGECY
ncbi:protein kinase C-binding protein NELL2a-like [Macrobrachium rosenbergii]|uniref:protein kinase C-binding protein NELL2a-like n=1 Tax=Macrobrachium rosenbergii TaxID=79674 RepID=UPI0034D5CE88